jgi:N-glycosylase/DNA lyase
MRLTLQAPPGFSFRRTVWSHGWYSLAPFRCDPTGDRLDGVLSLPGGGAVTYGLRFSRGRVVVRMGQPSGRHDEAEARSTLRRAVRRILNLDLDLSEFHTEARACKGMRWIADEGMGRMLRCPTVWEDLVKLVLTTNCSWAFTTRMVDSLVESYGDRAPDGSRSFPRPERLAAAGEDALRARVRAGYRAPHLARLAREVTEGRIDPESWEAGLQDPTDLRRRLLELPGVGPYVAENMLKLLGRPDGLALDSWLRAKYAQIYHGGRPVTDRTIARRYARMGEWGGLALWCEMTRDWLDDRDPLR